MFDALSERLDAALQKVKGRGRLDEKTVDATMKEIRLALLEADVNFKVAKEFLARVKEKSLGDEVLASVQPGQQIVKIIHDELVTLLGDTNAKLETGGNPTCIMMVGLHGAGKTTSSGKLAKLIKKQGRQPLLVAADVYRPAAMDQLETLGQQVDVPVLALKGEKDVQKIARAAMEDARAQACNVLIFDTAGRLQIDEDLVQELIDLKGLIKPQEILLVLDAATGQEAVSVATHFDEALGITGSILTKLDGDARGGAALSLKSVTGRPIKFVGVGEKLDEFESFHPERMAGRILGMGDVVSLVEKAAEVIEEDEAARMEEKLRKGEFSLEDFLEQMRAMKKLGPLENIVGMLPGGDAALKHADLDKGQAELRRMEALICAMTPKERRQPNILNASRRRRIASGTGVKVSELNSMLNKFFQMQQMMKKMGKMQKMMAKMGGGDLGGLGGLMGR